MIAKHQLNKTMKNCCAFLTEKKLVTEPLLSHVVSPEEAPKAFEGLKNRDENYFGVVINWD